MKTTSKTSIKTTMNTNKTPQPTPSFIKNKHRTHVGAVTLAAAVFGFGGLGLAATTDEKPAAPAKAAQVARGQYLVTAVGCSDCHTPHKLGPNGPELDMTRLLSGHPAQMVMPPAPQLPPGPWIGAIGATMTAWAGPWGTSFTANLTPDKETGLGGWTTRNFIETIRNARHQGRGRPLLPPMPFPAYRNFTDDDLAAIFAYLQSIPAVKNRVPAPLPPSPPPAVKTAAR